MAGRPDAEALAAKVIRRRMMEAKAKAWDALSRYKFWMFGYHAAEWVPLNRLLRDFHQPDEPNPWHLLVCLAREGRLKADLLEKENGDDLA